MNVVCCQFYNVNAVKYWSHNLSTVLGAFEKLRKATVRMEGRGTHWTNFHEIFYNSISFNLPRIFNFRKNLTRITGILHECLYTFLIISRSFLLRMKKIQKEVYRKSKHILYSIIYYNSVSLLEGLYTFLIISRSFLLRMEKNSERSLQKIKTRILYSIIFFCKNHILFEIMQRTIVERGRPQMTIRCMFIACSIPNTTNTHSDIVTLISTMVSRMLPNVTHR